MVASENLILMIDERSTRDDRSLTRRAMEDAMKELAAIHDAVDAINRDGYLPGYLPKGSKVESADEVPLEIRDDVGSLSVRTADGKSFEVVESGLYVVSGYVNPHEKGQVSIRIFNAATGDEFDEGTANLDRTEYVGWSSQENEKFFFESRFAIDSPTEKRTKEVARFEIWFHGKTDRKLQEATRNISTCPR